VLKDLARNIRWLPEADDRNNVFHRVLEQAKLLDDEHHGEVLQELTAYSSGFGHLSKEHEMAAAGKVFEALDTLKLSDKQRGKMLTNLAGRVDYQQSSADQLKLLNRVLDALSKLPALKIAAQHSITSGTPPDTVLTGCRQPSRLRKSQDQRTPRGNLTAYPGASIVLLPVSAGFRARRPSRYFGVFRSCTGYLARPGTVKRR
jgi:hypothetical protein